jgi:uncharacterized protein (TIGR00255 family)
MLQSMTGFGSATVENEKLSVTAEVKSLNSKFTDIYCRMPRNYSEKEVEIRNLLTQSLERGKIEFNLQIQQKGDVSATTTVNRGLIKAYFKDLEATSKELNFEPDPNNLLRMASMMPNVYNNEAANEEQAATDWNLIQSAVNQALTKCKSFRIQEGKAVESKFEEYISNIGGLLENVAEQDPKRLPVIRERLEKNVKEWFQSEGFDRNRFEQELIYYVEKYDISEEKVRLKNHLDYFLEELKIASNGKKLNFIAQEIGREINTIGSKANDSVLQRFVVQMKDELEKIKEQTMNIV